MPLLHRHTFEKSIADGLHQTDVQFAANVLLVCAIGSGFSQDPRVSTASYDQSCSPCWLWFYQSQEMQESLLHKPTLHIIQSYCVSLHLTSCSFFYLNLLQLSALFLGGSSKNQTRWALIGAGIRLVQVLGAHTKRKYGSKPTVASELWKRAFWWAQKQWLQNVPADQGF